MADHHLKFVHYEAHMKVEFEEGRLDDLKRFAEKFDGYTSHNTLQGRPNERFVTYQQFSPDPEQFTSHLDKMAREMESERFTVKKIVREVAVFDSKLE